MFFRRWEDIENYDAIILKPALGKFSFFPPIFLYT